MKYEYSENVPMQVRGCKLKNRQIRLVVVMLLLAAVVVPYQYCEAKNNHDLTDVRFNVLCEDTVDVGKTVFVKYVFDYGDQFIPDFLDLKIPEFKSDYAKLLFLSKTDIKESFMDTNGERTTTHKIGWTATMKTIKEGKFLTPEAILIYSNDTLNIAPINKTIEVAKQGSPSDTYHKKTTIKAPDNTIIRLVTVLDKSTINLGDSVYMRIKLQFNQNFSKIRFDAPIKIDDCLYEYIETFNDEPVITIVDGIECHEWVISELCLTPLKAGVIKIPKIKIKGNYTIVEYEQGSLPKAVSVPFKARSNGLKLKVKQP